MMRTLFRSLLVLVLWAPVHAATAPHLGVVLVVDQMRADYLERDASFSGGFKRLAREGAVFTSAFHLHLPTETGPGHAAISTGRAPATHGIVANDWYDRVAGAATYCVADEPYGIGPGHLSGPTLADALKAADPAARVFSVSGKDRAAVLLGGRRPDLAIWLDKPKGVFTTSAYYPKPVWLDAFNAELAASGLLPLKNGKVPAAVLASPAVDEATARLVAELMAREHVGKGASTDLLLVSFSATDLVGHRYGIEAPEMSAQLRALDAILGRMLTLWEKASDGRLVLALTADHGAIPAPEDPSGRRLGVKRVDWDELEAAMESSLQKRWPAAGEKWILLNSLPHLYLNRALAARRGLEWGAFLRGTAEAVSGIDGIDRALVTREVPEMDPKDPLAAILKRSVREDRAGDILVILRKNYLLHDAPAGTSHGTPWDYDAHVPLVFWGDGVKAARSDAPASPLDLAPTLGRLLSIPYAPADGGSLRAEILPASMKPR
jgi:arylsulfatase A-like enzyme